MKDELIRHLKQMRFRLFSILRLTCLSLSLELQYDYRRNVVINTTEQ